MSGLLLSLQIPEPEFVVGILEVASLIASIAMHAVRIDHEVELLAELVKGIDELQRVLMVNIVVSSTMCDLEHNRIHSCVSILSRIT